MSDEELRDKLAAEYDESGTGNAYWGFVRGWDAARANPIPVGAIIDVDQDALFAERDALKAEVERLRVDVEALKIQMLSHDIMKDFNKVAMIREYPSAKRLLDEIDSLTKLCLDLAEALEFYGKNKGLRINHLTNKFESIDSDGTDFSGATARKTLTTHSTAIAKIKEQGK